MSKPIEGDNVVDNKDKQLNHVKVIKNKEELKPGFRTKSQVLIDLADPKYSALTEAIENDVIAALNEATGETFIEGEYVVRLTPLKVDVLGK